MGEIIGGGDTGPGSVLASQGLESECCPPPWGLPRALQGYLERF